MHIFEISDWCTVVIEDSEPLLFWNGLDAGLTG